MFCPNIMLADGNNLICRSELNRCRIKLRKVYWLENHSCTASPPCTGASPQDSDLGGRIQVVQNHVPPNSDFSSDFALFILEILKNIKIWAYIQKCFFKNRDFWGDIPTEFWTGGDTSPPSPPRWLRPCGGDAHGHAHQFFSDCKTVSWWWSACRPLNPVTSWKSGRRVINCWSKAKPTTRAEWKQGPDALAPCV